MFNIFFYKSFINKLLTKNIYKLQNILKYNDTWNVLYKYFTFTEIFI